MVRVYKNIRRRTAHLNEAKKKKFIQNILNGIIDTIDCSSVEENKPKTNPILQSNNEILNPGDSDMLITTNINQQAVAGLNCNQDEILIPMNSNEQVVDGINCNQGSSSAPSKNNMAYGAIRIDDRRIINFSLFWEKLIEISTHGSNQVRLDGERGKDMGCVFTNLVLFKETRNGLKSKLHFYCNMCSATFTIDICTNEVNEDALEGALAIGIGFYNSEELFNTMNIPYMNQRKYLRTQKVVGEKWERVASLKMLEAAKEEADYARENGDVDFDGVPLISVVADGTWSKRSYRTNYNALSGAAAIIGHRFGKVLYLGVKNKFCTICSSGTEREHTCARNYSGSSTGMEASILVDGFRASEEMYGVRYSKFIADGDSSTYTKLLEARPYSHITIQKIECRNHLLRNFCGKLTSLSSDTRMPIRCRKLLGKNILRFRTAIRKAITHRKNDSGNIKTAHLLLKKDIDNSICHIFGLHDKCEDYFCNKSTEDDSDFKIIQSCTEFYVRLVKIVSSISNHCRSLIFDLDSNVVEQFNSIVCKFVGGKRVNYARGRTYQSRCAGAVVSYNTKRAHTEYKNFGRSDKSSFLITKVEDRRKRRVDANRTRSAATPYKKAKLYTQDQDYGESASKADLEEEIFQIEKNKKIQELTKTPEELKQMERDTTLQADDAAWFEYRRNILTASSFHAICTRKPTTNCGPLVTRLLSYKKLSEDVPSIKHGKTNEGKALQKMAEQENVAIEKNGLFIHPSCFYLGATPDGLVGKDLVVEVKCPYSAFGMKPDDAIELKKIKFWKLDRKSKSFEVNTNHSWYFQIQGQLHVTGRRGCLFGVWTGDDHELKVAYILRRDDFWAKKMEIPLKKFYFNCLLPELVDSRISRKMPVREPEYILKAQEEQKNKKKISDTK